VSAPEIVLARHGETKWSLGGRHTGRTDVPLTENGRRQAEALRPRLADRSFERVLVSPLSRAAETCRLVGLGDRAETRPELQEIDYGEAEGLTTAQMRERTPGWSVWSHETPGAEPLSAVGARLEPILAAMRETKGDMALFAHGHVLRVLAALWIGLPPAGGARLALSTGTLSVLGWEHESQVVRSWNC
jgi:broad specificity phosphatase PhoE